MLNFHYVWKARFARFCDWIFPRIHCNGWFVPRYLLISSGNVNVTVYDKYMCMGGYRGGAITVWKSISVFEFNLSITIESKKCHSHRLVKILFICKLFYWKEVFVVFFASSKITSANCKKTKVVIIHIV